jgi:glycine dehydrogenase subunit 1
MATAKKHIRRLPGRIVGRTVDTQGRECFCLTLQTREQHIRRERATSNVCTNQALVALRAAIYLCWLGPRGISELADLCLAKAVYARRAMEDAGFGLRFDLPFFREFVVELPAGPENVLRSLEERKIAGGIPLGGFFEDLSGCLLVAFTEKHTRQDIDRLVCALSDAVRTAGARP